jgi:hypothetical protein
MKLLTVYTDSHIPLLAHDFLPSLPNSFEATLVHLPQECPTGVYYTEGWAKTTEKKLRVILKHMDVDDDDMANPFLFSDVDMRFYGSCANDLLTCLGDADMAMQDDGPGGFCTGLFMLRPNTRTRKLIARAMAITNEKGDDQLAFNSAVSEGTDVTIAKLPRRYWNYGMQLAEHKADWHVWEPGMLVEPPADLLVHHSNWVKGIENKLACSRAVQEARR